jgi:hypothetical protein
MKITVKLIMVLSLILMTALPVRADIPAPPANQFIGINDGVFHDLVEDDCRLCHENPDQYPVEDETIPNRHHLLTGTEIPDPTDAPYGTPGGLFACLSCHEVEVNAGIFQFIVERDCLVCHTQASPHELTVHHRTDLALGLLPQGPDCKACHGSLVDNMEDGHFISAEPTTDQTPKRSGGNGLPLNSEGAGAGGCDYCHSTGTGDPMVPGVDSSTGVLVYDNETTHHAAFYFGSTPTEEDLCHWCHDFSLPLDEQIRVCEKCHGRDALHNIQVDSDDDGIINPGIEAPGYGHIGDPDDCWGCHGFSFMSSAPPEFGPIIPQVSSANKSIITAGSATVLTITGSAFINYGSAVEYTSVVTLTASDGTTVIELTPDAISESMITVTVPGTIATGNYALRAVKLDKQSNPFNLSVTPEVRITDLDCSKCLGTMTITGSGFSEKPNGTDEDIAVMENGRPLNIISWTDGEITVSGSRCSGTVEVEAIYGSASQSH